MATTKKRNKAYQNPNNRNQCWDDLNTIYNSHLDVIRNGCAIAQVITNPVMMERIRLQKPELVQTLQILQRDLETYSASLSAIFMKHKGNTGGDGAPDRYMQAMSIGNEYHAWMESYRAVLFPNQMTISSELSILSEGI